MRVIVFFDLPTETPSEEERVSEIQETADKEWLRYDAGIRIL